MKIGQKYKKECRVECFVWAVINTAAVITG